jgi:ATP-dependent DNA helicase RecG
MLTLKDYLKTTPKYIALLAENGIHTIRDFFLYFPRAYEDRKNLVMLADIQSEEVQYTVKMLITSMTILKTWKGRKIITYQAHDEAGDKATVNFFYAPYLVGHIRQEQWYLVIGKPKNAKKRIQFWHPEMVMTEAPEEQAEGGKDSSLPLHAALNDEKDSTPANANDGARKILNYDAVDPAIKRIQEKKEEATYQTNRIYPVYSEMQWIKSWWFAKKVRENKDHIPELFPEYLPQAVLKETGMLDYTKTIQSMHYPNDLEEQHQALRRVSFDKLLWVQLSSIMQKLAYQQWHTFQAQALDRDLIKEIIDALPFSLTQAQKKCIKAIVENLHETRPMLRLLQWDVGSGKTIVAAIAAYYVIKQYKWQVAFLAPLEVLAHQHYRSISKILLPLGIRVACITGSTAPAEKKRIKWALKAGNIDVVIGTHALLQDDIDFKNLYYVVIDEQHKFGVRQRGFFKKFGSPHILQMTATPIPRSMALAFFGEFEVSTIDEMPLWRKAIHTKIVSETEYKKLKQRVLTKLWQDQRLFIVTPLIDESEIMQELKSAKQEYLEALKLYPELDGKIWLLHGKLKPQEKQEVMERFKKWEYMVLVSTTVIEVGIDVPEATIMIIKNADRFGLAQLHQLRGRVWRSDVQSYCFLETKHKAGESYKRLRALEEFTDGFKLAELDLKYRGAGEFLWTRQSGITDIPYEMMSDTKFLEQIQQTAHMLLEKYPWLVWLETLKSQIAKVEWELLV